MLRDSIHEPFDPLSRFDPLADGIVERFGDVNVNPPVAVANVKIQSRMLLALLTAAVALTTSAVPVRQRAAEKGFVSEELSGPRTSITF
jgi:hypothetical protein